MLETLDDFGDIELLERWWVASEDPASRSLEDDDLEDFVLLLDDLERAHSQEPFSSCAQTNDASFSSTKISMSFRDLSQVNWLSSSIVESSMGVFALVKFSLSDSLHDVKRSPPAKSVIAIFFMG